MREANETVAPIITCVFRRQSSSLSDPPLAHRRRYFPYTCGSCPESCDKCYDDCNDDDDDCCTGGATCDQNGEAPCIIDEEGTQTTTSDSESSIMSVDGLTLTRTSGHSDAGDDGEFRVSGTGSTDRYRLQLATPGLKRESSLHAPACRSCRLCPRPTEMGRNAPPVPSAGLFVHYIPPLIWIRNVSIWVSLTSWSSLPARVRTATSMPRRRLVLQFLRTYPSLPCPPQTAPRTTTPVLPSLELTRRTTMAAIPEVTMAAIPKVTIAAIPLLLPRSL